MEVAFCEVKGIFGPVSSMVYLVPSLYVYILLFRESLSRRSYMVVAVCVECALERRSGKW